MPLWFIQLHALELGIPLFRAISFSDQEGL